MLSPFSPILKVTTLCDPVDVAGQVPQSMGFSSQEYWSGLPCPHPGDLPEPEIEPVSLMSPALADRFFLPLAAPGYTLLLLSHFSRVRLCATP